MSSISHNQAGASSDRQHSVGLLGVSHHNASFDILERLALAPEEIAAFYGEIAQSEAISDAMVLSTCNRTEIYTIADAGADIWEILSGTLRSIAGRERLPNPDTMHRSRGSDSVRHLFRVACGLDSMVLGEAQILGQIKDAFEISREHRPPSAYFEQVMQAAFKVARTSRAKTEIGRGAVSVASAGVQLSTRIFSDLSRCTVVVVGAGETGRLTAEHFAKHSPQRLQILNRSLARAEAVAKAVDGEALPLDQLAAAVVEADIVACAVRVSEPLLLRATVEAAMHARSGRPLALLDLGLPRNIASDADDIANVFLHDLDALKQVVDSNLSRRRKEVPRVEELIQTEIDRLVARRRVMQAGPLIAALRDAVEGVRRAEVKKATSKLSTAEIDAVDRATRAVINKLLHGPTTSIKKVARQQEEGAERLEIIRQMFGDSLLGDAADSDGADAEEFGDSDSRDSGEDDPEG